MTLALLLLAVVAPAAAPAPAATPRTLRLDLVHAGSSTEERLVYDGLAREGPWPGNPARPIDDTNLGKYLFEVRDRATNRLLYSRGFASIYGEWETTEEAGRGWRAFHESLRFPEPAAPVQLAVRKRGGDGLFRELWTMGVDPADPAIDRSEPAGRAWAVLENGPPAEKLDLVLLGDGYTAAEMDKWHADARRLTDILFSVSPFKERKSDFNVWAVDTPSPESGVSRPSDGVYRRSALRAAYDAFGSERYVLAFDDRRVREAAAAAPYDVMEIVVNGRKYGGGGIFNLYATVASDNAFTPYVFVHEFGHHFAGLADEYYTSDVAYGPAGHARPEPWEPNVTAEPRARPSGRTSSRRARRCRPPGARRRSRRRRRRSRHAAGRSAPRSGPRRRWRRCSARSSSGWTRCSARAPTRGRWAPSRARCTRPRATTAPRPTASCSRARTPSARPAAARSSG